MSVLFSELLVPGWSESGDKIGLGDITGTYGNPIANALPCHGAEPETFFSEAEADIKAAKALCGECPVRAKCLAGALSRQEPVGVCGIHHITNGVASVGYWVAPWGRKSGAASTALRILPALARRVGNAHTLQATIAESNTASRRTAERAGFQLIGKSSETCPNGDSREQGLQYNFQI